MVLTFMIIFVVASAWDVMHSHRTLDHMVNPGREQTQYR